jgi:hypothetical protein
LKNLVGYKNFLDHQIIDESLLSSINIEKIANPERIKDFSYQDDFLRSIYREENYLNDIGDDEIDEEDFLNWLQYDIRYKLEDLVDFYKSIIKNGKIKVWRKMTVNESWMDHISKEGKHLGVYWSWDPYAADTHWGDYSKNRVALIGAEVSENAVDWEGTLIANIQPLTGIEEREILLNKGVPLEIISIEIDGEKVDIGKIRGKRFYS